MHLLIYTQKVDTNDPVLGFFHGWIRAFAKHWETITVVCLEEGIHNLPDNVRVFSLGKEAGSRTTLWMRILYTIRFYRVLLYMRGTYDSIFVHMNAEYVALGGVFWRLAGKKVFLWYNHGSGTLWARIASVLTHKMLHTSPYAFPARFQNAVRMPVGIDTAAFTSQTAGEMRDANVLYLGRIAPIKGLHVLFDAARMLQEQDVEVSFSIYGDALPEHEKYYKGLQENNKDLITSEYVTLHTGIPNTQTPSVYSEHRLFVNLSPAGMYDKTVLEALACGCVALASSPVFGDVIPEELRFQEHNARDLADKIRTALAFDKSDLQRLRAASRQYVEEVHGLGKLAEKLYDLYAHNE